jgi:hypothetical protein
VEVEPQTNDWCFVVERLVARLPVLSVIGSIEELRQVINDDNSDFEMIGYFKPFSIFGNAVRIDLSEICFLPDDLFIQISSLLAMDDGQNRSCQLLRSYVPPCLMEKYRKEFDKMNDETNINFGPSIQTKEDMMAASVTLSKIIIEDKVVPNKFNFTIQGRKKSISGLVVRTGEDSMYFHTNDTIFSEADSLEKSIAISDFIWDCLKLKFARMEPEKAETTTQGA